jgi:hypothetical protein
VDNTKHVESNIHHTHISSLSKTRGQSTALYSDERGKRVHSNSKEKREEQQTGARRKTNHTEHKFTQTKHMEGNREYKKKK